MTMDNNNDVLKDLSHLSCSILNHMPSWAWLNIISIAISILKMLTHPTIM